MRNALLICSTLALFTSGCFIRYPTTPSSPAPSPAHVQRRMSRDEAVNYAMSECRSRRLDCRVQSTNLARGGDLWKVRMRAHGGGRKGHIHFEYDSRSRRLVDVDSKLRPWRARHAPRWNVDDDWDDDNDGIADWKDRRNPSRHHSASSPARPGDKQRKSNEELKKANANSSNDRDRKASVKEAKASSKDGKASAKDAKASDKDSKASLKDSKN